MNCFVIYRDYSFEMTTKYFGTTISTIYYAIFGMFCSESQIAKKIISYHHGLEMGRRVITIFLNKN